MSAFHNGSLRTMQAAYTCAAGDVRIIRPLLHCREAALKAFSYGAGLPVIADNCPACFEAPKERARIKKLLKREEGMFPGLFANLGAAMAALADPRVPPLLRSVAQGVAGRRHANKPRWAQERAAAAAAARALRMRGASGAAATPAAEPAVPADDVEPPAEEIDAIAEDSVVTVAPNASASAADAADVASLLSRCSEAALLAELARRGGLGIGAAAAGGAADAADADDDADADARRGSGAVCTLRPRA
jgi:hypothetical protein